MKVYECRYKLVMREDSIVYIAAFDFSEAIRSYDIWERRNRTEIHKLERSLQMIRELSGAEFVSPDDLRVWREKQEPRI